MEMKVANKKEKHAKKRPQSEVFEYGGPRHLTCVDWSIPEHKRSIAASLISGVYVSERDRQYEITKSQTPNWWEFFHFELKKTLYDKYDSSIIGITYESKLKDSNCSKDVPRPPKYVVALRGTMLNRKTRIRDVYINAKTALNGVTSSSRYETIFNEMEGLLEKEDPKNIWLVGHSLGAAIAIQIGKGLIIKNKLYTSIGYFFFNPPFTIITTKEIPTPPLKIGAGIALELSKGVLSALRASIKSKEDDENNVETMAALRSWTPKLFVNPKDPICRNYCKYFKGRKRGWNGFENSVLHMVVDILGRDAMAHLVPSAVLIENMKNTMVKEKDPVRAHSLCQWWEPHSSFDSKTYLFEENSTNKQGRDKV